MRIILIQHQDYANYSYDLCQAMKYVGLDCDAYVLSPHAFGYKKQAIKTSERDIRIQIKRADLIIVPHSCGTMYDMVKDSGKRIWVIHTGTRYRQNPEKHNLRWNELAEKVFICLGEFEHLGAKNPIFLNMTVNVNKIEPDYYNHPVLTFAHYPSNREVKGTETILMVMERLSKEYPSKFIFNYAHNIVKHEQQLQRMRNCDVYIELCAPEQNGKPYASFGTTALEAAAMGKVVVSSFGWKDIYKETYGGLCMHVANDEHELYDKIKKIIKYKSDELLKLKGLSRDWVVNNHSYQATGERMKKLIYGQY